MRRQLIGKALAVGHKCNITVYDSLYLVLAGALAAPLATLDERLQKTADSLEIAVYK